MVYGKVKMSELNDLNIPELVEVYNDIQAGNPQLGYLKLQSIIANPNIDSKTKAKLCDISLSIATRLLNSEQSR